MSNATKSIIVFFEYFKYNVIIKIIDRLKFNNNHIKFNNDFKK